MDRIKEREFITKNSFLRSIGANQLQHLVPHARDAFPAQRSGMNRLYPQYRFFFQGREHQLMMVAQKCSKNRSSNYHVFDMHRGGFRAVSY